MVESRTVGRIGIVFLGTALAATIGVLLLWAIPHYTALGMFQTVLLGLFIAGGVVLAGRFAGNAFPGYDVAEVEVDDVITRDGDLGPGPVGGTGLSADDVVEQIERADEDDTAEALIVKLNTPGGQVVPSEDIRRAAAEFDGPTVAYAEDLAASGGYWIASGCDEFHAREASVVGSIGVRGGQLGRSELADKAGLDYRRFVAGEYKDADSPWREIGPDEREYIQGLVDDYYEQFVDTVVEGREMDAEAVRDTEARVFLGHEAADRGLVDTVGPRDEMEDRLANCLDVAEITVETFEPERGLSEKVNMGVQSAARSFGAGVASAVVGEDDGLEIRI